MNPPKFTSSNVTKDPDKFLEELQKIFEVMQILDAEHVE